MSHRTGPLGPGRINGLLDSGRTIQPGVPMSPDPVLLRILAALAVAGAGVGTSGCPGPALDDDVVADDDDPVPPVMVNPRTVGVAPLPESMDKVGSQPVGPVAEHGVPSPSIQVSAAPSTPQTSRLLPCRLTTSW